MSLPELIREDFDIASWNIWSMMKDDRVEALEKAMLVELPLSMIEDNDLRAFAIFVFAHSHPSFWEMSSSSSGKYHPEWEKKASVVKEFHPTLKMGGTIKHTYAMLTMSLEALRRYGFDKRRNIPTSQIAKIRDVVVFAALLHDWAKNGDPRVPNKRNPSWGRHTYPWHGELCASIIYDDLLPFFIELCSEDIDDEDRLIANVKEGCTAIKHHYGVWSQKSFRPNQTYVSNKKIKKHLKKILKNKKIDDDEKIYSISSMINKNVKTKLSIPSLVIQEGDYYSSRTYLDFDPMKMKMVMWQFCPENISRES